MAKVKPQFSITSCGIYSSWDDKSKTLPKIQHFTTDVPAELDVEFGYILNVKKGKGVKLQFTIYHPDICDKNGSVMAPFSGDVYVKNNDWDFYLGDTLWEPIEDKIGSWRVVIEYKKMIIADKTFDVINKNDVYLDDYHLYIRSHKQKKRHR